MIENRPLLLDFYCCEGGASAGYAAAGFRVIGIDIDPQPRYPYEFIQGDALKLIPELVGDLNPAAVTGSPPCQDWSPLAKRTGKTYPRLIAPTRDLFAATGLPYVIENVEGARADLIDPITLCGSMWPHESMVDGLLLKRHRLFESNRSLLNPWFDVCRQHKGGMINVHGGGGYRERKGPNGERIGHGNKASAAEAAQLLGTPWMSVKGMNECIPPRYTALLGRQLISRIEVAA